MCYNSNMLDNIIKNKILKLIIDFFGIAAGAVLAAFAIEEFLVPNTILDGGIVGVSIIVASLTKWPLSLLTVAFNFPFLIIGSRKLGKMFIAKSAFAMALFAAFLQIFAPLKNATDQYLLAVSFGGVLLGVGVGLVIRFGGCLDGTETVAILLNRKLNVSVGTVVLVFNIVIFVVAGFLFGFDRAMYSLLTYFITSRVLDFIENGTEQTKAAIIITNDAEEISDRIFRELGRTVTLMEGEGLVSGKKAVLYCVVTRFEVRELRDIIDSVDESAFATISDVSEIIGNHIKKKGGETNA